MRICWISGVIAIRKYMISVLALVLFSATAVAQVPDFNVVPDGVDRSVSAYNQHEFEFTFSNQDSEDIHNITVENRSYLSWSEYSFDVNASESRTVNASFYTENITEINETLSTRYGYNGSDNRFDGENISIEVSTFYENTSVNLSALQTSFELDFGESDSSAFTVDNVGGEEAFEVELGGEDISFDRGDGFTVAEGEDALVQYDVSIPKPDENATEATNQTYTRTVTVSGANFNDTSFDIEVFVPFKQYDTEEAERSLVDQFIDFCSDPENSDSVICSDEQIVEYRNNTEYVNNTSIYRANFTEEEKTALSVLANTRSEDYQDILNRVKLQQNTFRSELEKTRSNFSSNFVEVESETEANTRMIRSLNNTINEYGERQLQEARNRTFWMQLGVAIIVLAVLGKLSWFVYENLDDWTRDGNW
jgi:hypothetical protein